MDWSERRRRFADVLAGSCCVHPASVFDPISARIAQDLGFEVGMFSGSVASLTVLGSPDIALLTLSEFAAQAYRINRASVLPLLVDADHGYGNALNVMRTIEELESAGVSAASIEDTKLPQPFGETDPSLLSIAEGVGKMRAALAARQDPGFTVIGRTSAVNVTGVADAIERAQAYSAAGVDAVFFAGGVTRAELDAIASVIDLPIILGAVSADLLDRDYLASRKVRIAQFGHQPFAAAVQAVHDTLRGLRSGVKPADLTGIASSDLMREVTRDTAYAGRIDKFLR
jgi:carboxyvinyl-carboxyphosphonate phosphorylmutase